MKNRPRNTNSHQSKRKGGHDPSAYRALIRDAKKSKSGDLTPHVREAKKLTDPYYTALALVVLSSDPRMPLDKATMTAEQGISYAGKENRTWRKVELLVEIHKKLSRWREEDAAAGEQPRDGKVKADGRPLDPAAEDVRQYLIGKVFSQAANLPPGKHRSEIVQGLAPRSDLLHFSQLAELAVENSGTALEDTRSVIRSWARTIRSLGSDQDVVDIEYPEMVRTLKKGHDPTTRSRLYGYLHLQLKKEKLSPNAYPALSHAIDHAEQIEGDNARLEALRYLSTVADTKDGLASIGNAIGKFSDPGQVARGLATLAGRMDKCGFTDEAGTVLQQALEKALSISDPVERALSRPNIAKGLELCGSEDQAIEALKLSLQDCAGVGDPDLRLRTEGRIISSLKRMGFPEDDPLFADFSERNTSRDGNDATIPSPPEDNRSDPLPPAPGPGPETPAPKRLDRKSVRSNHVLALYDTYEGGLKPTHLRAVARAAPLCIAYDLDLSLVGFPTDDLEALIKEVISDTNIGKGGDLLDQLLASGRITLIPAGTGDPPADADWPGIPVVTSSHPDRAKQVSLTDLGTIIGSVRADAASGTEGRMQNLCIIMGLGKKGLPPSLMKALPHHLELTGRNVPLETATVMGVIAERLRSLS